jgi:SAM-dependent methyltransferase
LLYVLWRTARLIGACCYIAGRSVTANDASAYYSDTLKSSADLQTSCCTTGTTSTPAHLRQALANVHPDVTAKYYGCGLVAPELLQGLRVLDLGCGAGRDCYVLSQLVGERGSVVGVDMSAAQLATATATDEWHRQRFGYARSNVRFVQCRLETLLQEDGQREQHNGGTLDTGLDTVQGASAAAGEGIKTEADSDGDEMSRDEDDGLEMDTPHDDAVDGFMPSPKPAAALVASQDDDAGKCMGALFTLGALDHPWRGLLFVSSPVHLKAPVMSLNGALSALCRVFCCTALCALLHVGQLCTRGLFTSLLI